MSVERQSLARVAFEAIWELDLATGDMTWDTDLETFGYAPAEVVPHRSWWRERVHPDDIARVEERAAELRARPGSTTWNNEYRFRRKDDSWAFVVSRCVFERDGQGRPVRAVGAMMDVSRLKETEARLRLFAGQIPARIGATDKDLRILWDLGAGFPEAGPFAGKTVSELFQGSPHLDRILEATQKALSGASSRLDVPVGNGQVAQVRMVPFRDPSGNVIGLIGVALDVTERARAEKVARESRHLLLDAEALGRTGSWDFDVKTGKLFNSEGNRRLFFGDVSGQGTLEDFTAAIHPDDLDRVLRERKDMLEGGGPGESEFRVVWPDGSEHVLLGRMTVVRDAEGKAVRAYGTNAEITELREKREQLQVLSRKLLQAQEAERRSIARELHDDFGQVLTALKLNLERHGSDTESIALVDGAIARMRDLAQNLRPPLLDEIGLEPSLRWYVQREAKRAGIESHVEIGRIEPRLAASVETALFRVAQEALTNVIRHAQASRVDVRITAPDGVVELVVRDDGWGFDVVQARRRATQGESQGLLGMQERVALAGGELRIDSARGQGAAVRVRIPRR